MINWQELTNMERLKYTGAPEGERFRMFCYKLVDLPYVWGGENGILGSDCSGTICFALYMMGYDVRVAANFLFRNMFTKHVKKHDDLTKIMAVFYLNENGKATHVTPVVGSYVVLDADGTMLRLRTARAVSTQFKKQGYDVVWRELDHAKLDELSLSGKYMYGLDPELELLRS